MDSAFSVGHRALIRVSLAVLLIDDLTGRQITGSNARAWIEKGKPPISKHDGWFVFTDLYPGEYTVNADGGKYLPCSVETSVGAEGMETLIIRLRPGRVYTVPKGCMRVEGRAEPGAEITVINSTRASGFRLLADCAAGDDEIAVFHPEGIRLDGRAFRLSDPDGSGEDVVLRRSSDPDCRDGKYLLTKPLELSHSRTGSMLFPCFAATADENGGFFMIISAAASVTRLICEARGSKTVVREYEQSCEVCFRPELTDE